MSDESTPILDVTPISQLLTRGKDIWQTLVSKLKKSGIEVELKS